MPCYTRRVNRPCYFSYDPKAPVYEVRNGCFVLRRDVFEAALAAAEAELRRQQRKDARRREGWRGFVSVACRQLCARARRRRVTPACSTASART